MKKWFASRLYQKIFLSFLFVALAPLLLVYFYINSRYYHKMEQDGVRMHQLAERNAGKQLEDFLTKMEYISNLFFNSNTQKLLQEDDDALSQYNARTALEKVVRVNLDLYRIMNNVDQITFLKTNGVSYDIMNPSFQGAPFIFQGVEGIKLNPHKNQTFLNQDACPVIPGDKLVYVRQINDSSGAGKELGYLFVMFGRDKLDRIFRDLDEAIGTRIVVENGAGTALYRNAVGEGMDAGQWLKWEYPLPDFGLTVCFYDETAKINANVKELSRMTELMILATIAIILVVSLLIAKTIL